ncbi:hypothetical protein GCM10008927_08950 [Amylibacter ulvae]|uniref:Uncharacterized protein n=1 Tax=Paramylibacter ulvae TaxID=1651968 RepID=A0ABQ3CXJ8_9RHOB|nr:hypothetical protein [Amylibacter ulvae]GHA46006.1 hypothetical protein GCM10008927_08950 [Amylibacter ulvae]
MVRRVGFSEPDTEAKKKRGVYRNAANDAVETNSNEIESGTPPGRLFSIIFLCLWLTGWSAAIFFVFDTIINGNGGAFLYVWLILALIGWCVAVLKLFTLVFGKHEGANASSDDR